MVQDVDIENQGRTVYFYRDDPGCIGLARSGRGENRTLRNAYGKGDNAGIALPPDAGGMKGAVQGKN